MKSIKERLAEKAAIKAKEDAKLSGPVNCFTVRIPWCGAPDVHKDSDLKFIQQRASETVDKIRHNAAYQFYEAMKKRIEEIDGAAAARRNRPGIWSREVDPARTFVQVNLNANGTITDANGRVYSPNDSYPPPPQGIRGVLNEDGRIFTADGTGNQYMTEFAMMPVIPPAPPTGVSEAVENLIAGMPTQGEALSHYVANTVTDVPHQAALTAEEVEQLESLTPAQRGDDLTPEEEDAILQPGEAPHTIAPPASYVPIEHRTPEQLEAQSETPAPITIALRPGENARSALIRYYESQLRPIAGCAEGIVLRPNDSYALERLSEPECHVVPVAEPHPNMPMPCCEQAETRTAECFSPVTNEHTDQCHCVGCSEGRVSEDDPRNPRGER